MEFRKKENYESISRYQISKNDNKLEITLDQKPPYENYAEGIWDYKKLNEKVYRIKNEKNENVCEYNHSKPQNLNQNNNCEPGESIDPEDLSGVYQYCSGSVKYLYNSNNYYKFKYYGSQNLLSEVDKMILSSGI